MHMNKLQISSKDSALVLAISILVHFIRQNIKNSFIFVKFKDVC